MRIGILVILLILRLSGIASASPFYEERDFREIFIREFKRLSPQVKGEFILERFRFEPDNLKIPKGLPYRIDWIGTPRPGSNTAIVIFEREKGQSAVIRLWGYVEVKALVPVLKQNLSAKSVITDEDITFELKELSKLPHDVILDKEKIVGKETRTFLKAGTILRASYLSEPLLVKRNQVVEILAKGKNFTVKAKGLALENGRANELIRIQNLSSKKIIQGKVVGEGLVEVYF